MTPFVSALLIKLTLILSLGLVVVATLRSVSPSFRHLILYATLASCMALPFAMWMSPQWDVPVLPRSFSTAVSSLSGRPSELPAADRRSNPFAGSSVLRGITNAPPSNSALNARVIDAGAAQRTADTRRILAAVALLPVVPVLWVVGFAAVIVWLAIGRIGLRRIAASAWPLDSSDWSGILDEERNYARVTKPVRLYLSSVVSTPLTWGSRAPVVLLPEDALDWPEEHRRIVLRHELAHVARGDSFTQLIAGFVCALYWFHPLVWIAERRLRAECERACDDNVVSLGTPAAEYAAHLLEVARSARAFGAAGFLSVAMARPSQLEGRLLAVLNESRRHVSLSRGARPAAALLAALVLIPLAAFRPVPKKDRPAGDAVASQVPKASIKLPTRAATTAPATSSWSAAWSTAASSVDETKAVEGVQADTTFQLSVAASLFDQLLQTVQIIVAPAVFVHADHRRDRGAGGVIKESSDEMFYRGLADVVVIRSGKIDVAGAILFVAEMTFALEQAQHPSHGGVGRRIGNIGQHFSRVRSSPPIDDLHDLPFSAPQLIQSALLHWVISDWDPIVRSKIPVP